jgi:hypothetical protein
MADFAVRTGLEPASPAPRRYLWTDAFAVCNFLGLARAAVDPRGRELALRLVEQVHRTLGRHHPGDARRGWISGLDEATAARHPTRGGLRIGKELPERGERDPYDQRLEWDRDGQYFHYLTQWMHALRRVWQETGDATFLRWARELAVAAHTGFVRELPQGDGWTMVWKMSTDLMRPLVPTMGHHDPLDALVTDLTLETAGPTGPRADARPPGGEARDLGPSLAREIAVAAAMCARRGWVTDDPLGIGGLLLDAARLAEIVIDRERHQEHLPLLERLFADSAESLATFARTWSPRIPAAHRLAFRELGLAIGLRGIERARGRVATRLQLTASLREIERFYPLARAIEELWADPDHRRGPTWLDHVDINQVMLATALLPAGFLGPPLASAG